MPKLPVKLTMMVEPDLRRGAFVQHVFPAHQDHLASLRCTCKPEIMKEAIIYESPDVSVAITFYFHWDTEVGYGI
jgi:hypothetical protein